MSLDRQYHPAHRVGSSIDLSQERPNGTLETKARLFIVRHATSAFRGLGLKLTQPELGVAMQCIVQSRDLSKPVRQHERLTAAHLLDPLTGCGKNGLCVPGSRHRKDEEGNGGQ